VNTVDTVGADLKYVGFVYFCC